MFMRKKLVFLKCLRAYSTNVLIKEKKMKIGKYDINYLTVGNGPHTVLLAPGALGTVTRDFKPQIDGFMRDKFRLVVWEPPGYGKSYPPEREFTVDVYHKDAEAIYTLMKELQIPKFSVLGFSDGGTTSLILAAKYPEVIKKLVVFGGNSYIVPSQLAFYKTFRDVSTWPESFLDPLTELYGRERLAKTWAKCLDLKDLIYDENKGNICSELLKDIKSPTLILHGQQDPILEDSQVTYLHEHIKGSRLHLYPEGSHYIHFEFTEDVNKRVQKFLLEE